MGKFNLSKKWIGLGAFVAGAGLGGAAVGQPGLKRPAARDAAITAGALGVGAMALHHNRVALAKAFVNHGKTVFRRVRGRIIAIKIK
jgi:hypothetical protein